MFSDEDVKAAFETMAGRTDDGMETLRAIMTKTAELLAARGGTMTATAMDGELSRIHRHISNIGADTWREHCAAQGARVAVLEEQLSAEREANRELTRRAQQAESERDRWQKEHSAMTIQAKDAREEARALKTRCATLSAAGQVLSEHVDRKAGAPCGAYELARNALGGPLALAPNVERCDTAAKDDPQRWPCSPTCTHDDAAKPGHPERVKKRSESVKSLSEKVLPGPDVLDGGSNTRGAVRVVSENARRTADAYADGAEAMRAACWEAVRQCAEAAGAHGLLAVFKAAIEGAAP